jgi:hypothetical protein
MFRLQLHPAALDAVVDVAPTAPPLDARHPSDTHHRPDAAARSDREVFWSLLRSTLAATAGR